MSCDLFVDLEPVLVDQPSRSTSQYNQRRFSVATMSAVFMDHSRITMEQSALILTFEHIKLLKGRYKKSRDLTVKWYCAQYKELYPTTLGDDEAGASREHQRRVCNVDHDYSP